MLSQLALTLLLSALIIAWITFVGFTAAVVYWLLQRGRLRKW